MEKIVITGAKRLTGKVEIGGAKNSALKLMAASILADGVIELSNVPQISDVATMVEVLKALGVEVNFLARNSLSIDSRRPLNFEAPYQLVNQMRASIIVLGPLLARLGRAKVALPGGCNIGSRKIDLHIRGLELLGAKIEIEQGFIEAKAPRLKGATIPLDFPSVGATENLMMAAALAQGTTIIENAAREPEIVDLADFLNEMGADIGGAGTPTLVIRGVDSLKGIAYKVIPDRIEAGTFLVAAAITRGEVFVEGAIASHLTLVLGKLREIGMEVEIFSSGISLKSSGHLKPVNICTLPYPGFPTDLQALFMALLSLAKGSSIITENVFENRFSFVDELRILGSQVEIKGHHAIVTGIEKLKGATVRAPDLRAGAALVAAGLAAEGVTEVLDVFHIDRGYEDFILKLQNLGAKIRREKAEDYPAPYLYPSPPAYIHEVAEGDSP